MRLSARIRRTFAAPLWRKVVLAMLLLALLLPLLVYGGLWYVSAYPDVPPHRSISQVINLDPTSDCAAEPVDKNITATMPAGAFDKDTRDPKLRYQGWCEASRQVYYRLPQGTSFFGLRYDWVANFEVPVGQAPLITRDYMESIGFIYDGAKLPNTNNPANLPIGLTWHYDQQSNKILDVSCAACHSSQLTYRGKALQIDGGSGGHALTSSSPSQFIGRAVLSLFTTWFNPFKFERFANKVLIIDQSRAASRALRAALGSSLWEAAVYGWYNRPSRYPVTEGYGRTDGLARIANTVFADNLDRNNYRIGNAPVNYPHVWDIWAFDWVQWMGSVNQPMARNLNEALGVRAQLELKDHAKRFSSSVMLQEIHCIETVLQHLKPPHWPTELFGQIDAPLSQEGKVLFDTACLECHGPFRFDQLAADAAIKAGLPATDIPAARPSECRVCHGPWFASPGQLAQKPVGMLTPAAAKAIGDAQASAVASATVMHSDPYWLETRRAWVWQVAHIDLDYIGTDPTSALNFINNTYDLSALQDTDGGRAVTAPRSGPTDAQYIVDWKHVPAGPGLRFIGGEVRYAKYREMHLFDSGARVPTPDQRSDAEDLNGFGEHDRPRAWRGYRPRPLEGVWATAPFLHNGSVPTLYELLGPDDERAMTFHVGRKEYDPQNLGLETGAFKGAFLFDTRLTGNSNRGHSFDDGMCSDGIIGFQRKDEPGYCRRFTEHERRALLEYLKVLSDGDPEPLSAPHCENVHWPDNAHAAEKSP